MTPDMEYLEQRDQKKWSNGKSNKITTAPVWRGRSVIPSRCGLPARLCVAYAATASFGHDVPLRRRRELPSCASGAPILTQPLPMWQQKVFICHRCNARKLVVTDQHPTAQARTANFAIETSRTNTKVCMRHEGIWIKSTHVNLFEAVF